MCTQRPSAPTPPFRLIHAYAYAGSFTHASTIERSTGRGLIHASRAHSRLAGSFTPRGLIHASLASRSIGGRCSGESVRSAAAPRRRRPSSQTQSSGGGGRRDLARSRRTPRRTAMPAGWCRRAAGYRRVQGTGRAAGSVQGTGRAAGWAARPWPMRSDPAADPAPCTLPPPAACSLYPAPGAAAAGGSHEPSLYPVPPLRVGCRLSDVGWPCRSLAGGSSRRRTPP